MLQVKLFSIALLETSGLADAVAIVTTVLPGRIFYSYSVNYQLCWSLLVNESISPLAYWRPTAIYTNVSAVSVEVQ